MSENIVTGSDNNPVVQTQATRRQLSPLQRIPQGNPFVQMMQQGRVAQEQENVLQQDLLMQEAEAEAQLEEGAPDIVQPEVSVSELYETLDPTVLPMPNTSTWLQENAAMMSQIEGGLLDEYSNIDMDVATPTYPILARPSGLSKDVDIARMNARIEQATNQPLINLNPEGVSTPGAPVRRGQPDPTRNIAQGSRPAPQGRPNERENMWGLRNQFRELTSLGRLITEIGANAGNLPALIGRTILRGLSTEEEQTQARTGLPIVDEFLNVLENQAPMANPSRSEREQGTSPYISDPRRGYFGEFGTGLTGAGIAGVSLIGNLTMSNVYSTVDLMRALQDDYPTNVTIPSGVSRILGGNPNGETMRNPLGLPYQLYRAATEGLSGSSLPGGRDLYAIPGFRYRQAFNFTDLGFTNFRQPNDSRYLATIDPDAPAHIQVAQGALGLALDAGAFGWVDDAVWGAFARGGRLFLRGTTPITSVPNPPPTPGGMQQLELDLGVTPNPVAEAVPEAPTPVRPPAGDQLELDFDLPTVGGLQPAPVYRPDGVQYAIPPGAPDVSSLAPALPLPRRVEGQTGYSLPNPWELPDDVGSVVTRATTPEASAYVTPSTFIRAFENNRFILPPAIELREADEISELAASIFPELGDDVFETPLTTREARVLDDLSNGLLPPYGRPARRLRLVHPIPRGERMGELITNVPFGRAEEGTDDVLRQFPQDVQQDLTPSGERPSFRNSIDYTTGTVLNREGNRVFIYDLDEIEFRQFAREMGLVSPQSAGGRQAWNRFDQRNRVRAVPDEGADVIDFPVERTTSPEDAPIINPAQPSESERVQELLGRSAEFRERLQEIIDTPMGDLFDRAEDIMSNPLYRDEPLEVIPLQSALTDDSTRIDYMSRVSGVPADELASNVRPRQESDIAYGRNRLLELGGEATTEDLRAAMSDLSDGEFAVTINDMLKNDIIVRSIGDGYVLTEFGVNMDTLSDFEFVLDIANRLSRESDTLTESAVREAAGVRLSDEEFAYVWNRMKRDANVVVSRDGNVRVISEVYGESNADRLARQNSISNALRLGDNQDLETIVRPDDYQIPSSPIREGESVEDWRQRRIREDAGNRLTREESAIQDLGTKVQWVQDEMLNVRQHMDDLQTRLVGQPSISDVTDEIAIRTMYGEDRYQVPELPGNVRIGRLRTIDSAEISTGSWYHGTRNAIVDLNSVDPKIGSSSNELGAGIYLTRNPQLAEVYAQAERSMSNPLIETRQLANGQVIEAEVLVGKTIDSSAKVTQTVMDGLRSVVKEAFGEDVARLYNPESVRDMWLSAREAYANARNGAPIPELQYQKFQALMNQALQKAGFDSIYDPPSGNLVVLDPVSITTRRANVINEPTMTPREARLAGDSVLRSTYRDNPVVEAMVNQSMLKVENDLLQDLVDEYNYLSEEAKRISDDLVRKDSAKARAELDAIEERMRVLENTIDQTVVDEIEPEVLKGVEDTCL